MKESKVKQIREFIDIYDSKTNMHVYLADTDFIDIDNNQNWQDEISWIEVLGASSKFLFVDEWTNGDHKLDWLEDSRLLEKLTIIIVDNSRNIHDSINMG